MTMRKTIWLWIFAFIACSSVFASSYPFEHPDPEEDFIRLKSVDMKSLSPEELARLGWYYNVYENANDKAEEIFAEAILKSPEEVWALYGMTVLCKIKSDCRGQLQYTLMLTRTAPDHPLSEIAFNGLRQLAGTVDGIVKPGKELLSDAIYNNKIKDPFVLNMAASTLSSISRLEGNERDFDTVRDRVNYVKEWRLAGPFGLYENLAFYSVLPPETEKNLGKIYDFADEEIVTRSYESDTGIIDAYFMKNGVYFAETYLHTKEPQEVVLFISSGKSIKCSLNGTDIYEKDLIREFGPATAAISVTLRKGWNRLTLKFVSYRNRKISVQIFDPDAGIPAVKISSKPRKAPDAESVEAQELVSPGIKYFTEKTEVNSKDPLASALLAICHSLTGNIEEAKKHLYRGLELAPDYAYSNYLLAHALEKDNTQPRDIARGESKKLFERAIETAGQYPSALGALATYSADEKRDTEAIRKLKEVTEQAPHFYSWHKKLYELYTAKRWEKERYRELLNVVGLLQESTVPLVMQRDYYHTKRMFDKYAEAVEKLQQASINGKHLAVYYKKTGETEKAIAEYKKLKKLKPYDSDIYAGLSELYERKGKFRSAQREIEKLYSFYPEDTRIMLRLAQLYSLGGNDRKAEKMYRRILAEDPLNVNARKALELGGDKEFFDKYEIDVWQYINNESLREKYKSLSSVIVIDQTVEEVFPNGDSRFLMHQLVLVNTKEGIEKWAEVAVPANSEFIELRTIKPDGTIIEPEAVSGKKSISMTDTAEGDFIETKYITRSRSAFGKRKAYISQRFFFQMLRYPMVISQYIIAAPKEIELDFDQVSMMDEPETWEEDGLNFYKWERHDIPEIKPEPYSVSQYEYIPNIHAGFNLDPELQSKITVNSNLSALKASREVILKTTELIEGLSTPKEKVRAIYDYVCTEIDGGTGSPILRGAAGVILGNKRGDRLSLMKTMLNVAGIPSNVVMVMSRTIKKSESFPAYYSYPLLVMSFTDTDEMQFLDLNYQYSSYGYIPLQYQGAEAKILADYPAGTDIDMTHYDWEKLSTPVTTPVLPITANGSVIDVTLDVTKDGSISGALQDSYAGSYAASIRANLQKIEEFNLRNTLERGLSGNYRGAKLENYEITALMEINKPLGIIYKFTAPNYATVSNENLIFSQGFYRLNLGKTYVNVPERQTPMGLYRANYKEHNMTLNLPEGCRVSEMPESFSLNNKYGTYEFDIKAEGNTLVLHRTFFMPIQKIAPEDYDGFVEFCEKIDKIEEKDLKVTLPVEPEVEIEKPANDGAVEKSPPQKETIEENEKELEEVTEPS